MIKWNFVLLVVGRWPGWPEWLAVQKIPYIERNLFRSAIKFIESTIKVRAGFWEGFEKTPEKPILEDATTQSSNNIPEYSWLSNYIETWHVFINCSKRKNCETICTKYGIRKKYKEIHLINFIHCCTSYFFLFLCYTFIFSYHHASINDWVN
jgi:hypothetical protein